MNSHPLENIVAFMGNMMKLFYFYFIFNLQGLFLHFLLFRSMFREKFLLWKVFPICCSRWILHFAVFECAPSTSLAPKACNVRALMDTVQHLTAVWSKREFVQSAPVEQQACILFFFFLNDI